MTKYDKKWFARLVDDPTVQSALDDFNRDHKLGKYRDAPATIERLDHVNQQRVAVGAPDPSATDTVHCLGNNLVSTKIVQDLDRIVQGRGEIETEFVREQLQMRGIDPDHMEGWSEKKRRVFHNECIRELRRRLRDRDFENDTTRTYDMLLVAKDNEVVIWSPMGLASGKSGEGIRTTAGAVRAALGMSVEDMLALPTPQRLKVFKKVDHKLRRGGGRDVAAPLKFTSERTALHLGLCDWAGGELRLEKPQSSSLHLMIEYDKVNTMGEFSRALEGTQIVVVENDWGASVPPVEGEWRLPYPLMCWEFRISGVRVLAFTDAETLDVPQMYCVYGRDGHWVIDDFYYHVSGGAQLGPGISHRMRAEGFGGRDTEFRRVASMVHAAIRAVCIMMDAQVAKTEHVPAPAKLVEKRRAENRTPPRDHIVVRLFGHERRAYVSRPKVAGRISDVRASQRGHWRRGTWVHYDDPDSGQVQYANDGGFIVSKTWRRWHFAGDPNNILHKELRA